jgi:hypothetical protein
MSDPGFGRKNNFHPPFVFRLLFLNGELDLHAETKNRN